MQAGENYYGGRMGASFNTIKNLPNMKEGYVSVFCMQPGYISTVKTEFQKHVNSNVKIVCKSSEDFDFFLQIVLIYTYCLKLPCRMKYLETNLIYSTYPAQYLSFIHIVVFIAKPYTEILQKSYYCYQVGPPKKEMYKKDIRDY